MLYLKQTLTVSVGGCSETSETRITDVVVLELRRRCSVEIFESVTVDRRRPPFGPIGRLGNRTTLTDLLDLVDESVSASLNPMQALPLSPSDTSSIPPALQQTRCTRQTSSRSKNPA